MDQVISFIQANFVWFIIGIIVIAMTVVGYFAEKKGLGFVGKNKSEKEDYDENIDGEELKSNSKEEGIADIVNENNEEAAVATYEEPKEEEVVDEPVNLEPTENLYKPLDINENNSDTDINGIPEELYAPIGGYQEETIVEEPKEDLYAPIQDTAVEPIAEQTVVEPTQESMPDELYAPVNNEIIDNEQVFTEEVSEEPKEDPNSEYSRLFPSDPIIIGGEEKKEEASEEVTQEDLWNV